MIVEGRHRGNGILQPLGSFFIRSLARVKQNRVLIHFQFVQRFYLITVYREHFHESI